MAKNAKDKGDKSDLVLFNDEKELIVCSSKNLKISHVGKLDIGDIKLHFDRIWDASSVHEYFGIAEEDYM